METLYDATVVNELQEQLLKTLRVTDSEYTYCVSTVKKGNLQLKACRLDLFNANKKQLDLLVGIYIIEKTICEDYNVKVIFDSQCINSINIKPGQFQNLTDGQWAIPVINLTSIRKSLTGYINGIFIDGPCDIAYIIGIVLDEENRNTIISKKWKGGDWYFFGNLQKYSLVFDDLPPVHLISS